MPSAIIYLATVTGILASQGSLALPPNLVLPSSTTTLGEPLQLTRSLPESTTTLGSTRSTLDTVATPQSSTQGFNSSATLPSVHARSAPHSGWVGFFKTGDCKGDPIGERRTIYISHWCYELSPPAGIDIVGVDFGSKHLGITLLDAFSDKDCKTKVSSWPNDGINCHSMKENGGVWRSVKKTDWSSQS